MIRRKRKELFSSLSSNSSPLRIQMELTRKCNLRCVHCVLDHRRKRGYELTPEDLLRLLEQMRDSGVFLLNFTGGELFTRPDADEIVGIALDSDFLMTIQTNGTLLTAGRIRRIAAAGRKVNCVAVSLYGATPEVHDRVTKTPGSFRKTVRAIRMMHDAGISTEASTLLMTLNFQDRDRIDDFCRKIGVSHQFYSIVIPREGRDTAPLKYRLPEQLLEKLPRPWETIITDLEEFDPADFKPGNPLDSWCTMGRTNGFITSSGDVLPCSIVNLPAGNVREKSFGDIWNNSPVMERIRNYRIGDFECSGCGKFPKCRPCPGLGLYEHGDIFKAPEEVCRIMRVYAVKEERSNERKEKVRTTRREKKQG